MLTKTEAGWEFRTEGGQDYVLHGGLWKSWARPTLSAFTDKQWGDLSPAERRTIGGHFAWAPAGAATFDELKLPFKDPSGGVNPDGVRAALSRLPSTQGIPEASKARIRAKLQRLLAASKT